MNDYASDKKVNVYVPNGVLHILYTLSLIRHNHHDNNLIFLLNEHEHAPRLADILNREFDCATATLLPGRFSYGGWIARQMGGDNFSLFRATARGFALLVQLHTKLQAKSLLAGKQPQTLYVFDDTRLDVQSILNIILNQNKDAKVHYVEDGVGAYHDVSVSHPWKRRVERPLQWIYGSHIRVTSAHGAHPEVEYGIVLKPQDVNAPLRRKHVLTMPPFSLSQADIQMLATAFDLDISKYDEISSAVLLLPPRSDTVYASGTFIDIIREIVAQQADKGNTVLVKYHPREAANDFLKVKSLPNVRLVDRGIPAELLCTVLGERMKALYAVFSSTLLTTGWILPQLTRYLIDPLQSGVAENNPARQKLKDMMLADGVKLWNAGTASDF